MRQKSLKKLHKIAVTWILIMLWASTIVLAEEPFVIIANPQVAESQLSVNALKDIFLGTEIVWKDSKEIKLCTLSESDTHQQFTRDITRKTTKQFKAWWKQRLFLGQGSMPPEFKEEGQLIEYVSKTEGAIGYVSSLPPDTNVKKIEITK